MGVGSRYAELHLHAPGVVLNALILWEPELFRIRKEDPAVPGLIAAFKYAVNVYQRQALGEAALVHHQPIFSLSRLFLSMSSTAQDGVAAAVSFNKPQQSLYSGAFALTIFNRLSP